MNELITTCPIEIVASDFCSSCQNHMTPEDNFCRHCGADCRGLIVAPGPIQLHPQSNYRPTEVATSDSSDFQKLVDNRLVVIGMITFVGPLGLLALWYSRRFSKLTKTLVTFSYAFLTFALPVAIVWYWLHTAMRPIVDVLGQQ